MLLDADVLRTLTRRPADPPSCVPFRATTPGRHSRPRTAACPCCAPRPISAGYTPRQTFAGILHHDTARTSLAPVDPDIRRAQATNIHRPLTLFAPRRVGHPTALSDHVSLPSTFPAQWRLIVWEHALCRCAFSRTSP